MEAEFEQLEDVENQFNCGICMDIFFAPVSLPCGHSFCFSCLYSYVNNGGPKKCPACREEWDIWPKTNIVLNQFLQKAFPVRYKRGFHEKEEERILKRKELELKMEDAQKNRNSILIGEGKVLIVALVILFLIWWKKWASNGQYYL